MKREYLALCVVIVLGVSSLTGCGNKSYLQEQTKLQEDNPSKTGTEQTLDDAQSKCFVQVSGAVNKPGVYQFAQGSRVYQAIEKAGGLRKDACVKDLNQARVLTDGEMIYVNTEAELLAMTSSGEGDGKININTATAEELTSLPGIGETRAQTIIDYRESNGLFSSPEDLKQVSGIGESTYRKLQSAIKVN